jgi:transcriptional regulator with XRE-family HTH domain
MAQSAYGVSLRRARYDAARRLGMPELESVDEAAKILGITRGYLYKVENGEKKPSFDMLETMAEKYGVLMGDLLPSSSIATPETDRILAPVLSLPPELRNLYMQDMEATARRYLAGMNLMRTVGYDQGYSEARQTGGAMGGKTDSIAVAEKNFSTRLA